MHLIQTDWIKWCSLQVRGSTVGQSPTCGDAALSLPHCLTLRRLAHFTIWAPFFTSTVSGYIRGWGRGLTAEEVWGFRISWMTGAEQEVEVILVRGVKQRRKGQWHREGERERETNPQRRQTVSRGHTNRGHKTGSETEMWGRKEEINRGEKKEEIMYKQSSKDRSGGWQMESQVVVQSNVR